ncbi:MAG: dephospho-CoA kinase [Planctomycetota bacterium]
MPDPPHDVRPAPEPRPTVVFGVLGGIASGKSRVARLLAGEDGIVLDADATAHRALDDDPVRSRVVARPGPGMLAPDGGIDRSALARVVFDDPGARKELEGWIHPVVRATLSEALEDALSRGVPRVVLDVPLLLENADEHGFLDRCDHLVFVDAPLDVRAARATRDRGWERDEVSRREAAQMPLARKRVRSDVVIENDGDLDELERAVADALRSLLGS